MVNDDAIGGINAAVGNAVDGEHFVVEDNVGIAAGHPAPHVRVDLFRRGDTGAVAVSDHHPMPSYMGFDAAKEKIVVAGAASRQEQQQKDGT